MRTRNYQFNDKEVDIIVTSLTCSLMSKLPNESREIIKSIINYLVKGGR